MVPILILFEEKKFWRYFTTGGTLTQNYGQSFFSSNNINMGTIWKIELSWNFLNYFNPIFTNTGQKYVFFGIKLRYMSKKPTGSLKKNPKNIIYFAQLYAFKIRNLNLFSKMSYLSYFFLNFTFSVRFYYNTVPER